MYEDIQVVPKLMMNVFKLHLLALITSPGSDLKEVLDDNSCLQRTNVDCAYSRFTLLWLIIIMILPWPLRCSSRIKIFLY